MSKTENQEKEAFPCGRLKMLLENVDKIDITNSDNKELEL
jgi:hypothetical protein